VLEALPGGRGHRDFLVQHSSAGRRLLKLYELDPVAQPRDLCCVSTMLSTALPSKAHLRTSIHTSFGMKIAIWRSRSASRKGLLYAHRPIPGCCRTPNTPLIGSVANFGAGNLIG